MKNKKLKILIDTNVAITYISGIEDKYADESVAIIKHCANGKCDGLIALHSIATIWYYTRRLPQETRREWLLNICTALTVVGVGHNSVIDAIKKDDFFDFEDCLQDKCAKEAQCDYIATVNTTDFQFSEVLAVNPAECLSLIDSEESGDDWV